MAHKIAQVLEISPWEALLLAVKRAAAWAAFYESKLAEVEDDDDLRPNGSAYHWVESAERVNEKLARWSKMAVDAGVQKILIERAQTEGALIAQVMNAAIAGANLDEETERRLRAALRQALLSQESAMIAETPTSSGEEDVDLE